MLNTRLDHLFELCIANKASAAEREELMELLADKANEDQVNNLFNLAWKDYEPVNPVFDSAKTRELLNNILNIDKNNIRHLSPRKVSWSRIAVAASILLVLSAGVYFYIKPSPKSKPQTIVKIIKPKTRIVPGSDKAILVLANGTKIALDNATTGEIAKQTGIQITKTKQGQLIYTIAKAENGSETAAPVYNTIEVPRGGQWEVHLADGSTVWLNSASSLRYPTAFTGNERKVELTGEAYFEVAKNKAFPFRVVSQNQIVEVLGTHFNINSYTDEAKTKTTLLEGSVKVSGTASLSSTVLKPGEQSVIKPSSSAIEVKAVDVEDAVAWKNGYFMFPNEGIESCMRKIARWYDMDVEYSGNVYQKGLWGTVSKFKNVNEVLNILEQTGGVHFKIDGRRIIVMP